MEIDFSKAPQKYWSDVTKISYLQRRIIVYSLMYYELNESCLDDKEYDELSRQLVHLQRSVDLMKLKKTQYYYCMYDYDGSTGFDISDRLKEKDKEYLLHIAGQVLYKWKGKG